MSVATKPPPTNWPRLAAAPSYVEAAKAIDWLTRAFGFEVRLRVDSEGGKIAHAELVLGGGLIMLGDVVQNRPWRKSPRELGGATTQSLMVFVDDVDAHCERARASGATIATEPATTDYGAEYWADRTYEAVDLEGHHWYFVQRVRDPK